MIGRIEKVPLREVWKNEAKDFTAWLFENLDIIGEELDMDLTPDEKEAKAGSFLADIGECQLFCVTLFSFNVESIIILNDESVHCRYPISYRPRPVRSGSFSRQIDNL